MEKYYFGFDIGGTNIKAGIISDDDEILHSEIVPTQSLLKEKTLAEVLANIISKFERETEFKLGSSDGIGIGMPGWVNMDTGVIEYANNIDVSHYPLKEELENLLKFDKIYIGNDAYVATLAECKTGAGKKFKNFVMLTLGTGIGGGIVLNGEVLKASCEPGHMKISSENVLCSCGESGCFEVLASTRALVQMTANAMKENTDSDMWKTYDLNSVSGKTVFDYLEDNTAREVLEKYIVNLGSGIVNLVNIFQPEAIVIGGAISAQKDNLIIPLEKYVNEHTYGRYADVKVNIISAELNKDAGLLGTKYLID